MERGPGRVGYSSKDVKDAPRPFHLGTLAMFLPKQLFSNEYPSALCPNPLLSFFRFIIPGFLRVA
jgi:hypothetical protein